MASAVVPRSPHPPPSAPCDGLPVLPPGKIRHSLLLLPARKAPDKPPAPPPCQAKDSVRRQDTEVGGLSDVTKPWMEREAMYKITDQAVSLESGSERVEWKNECCMLEDGLHSRMLLQRNDDDLAGKIAEESYVQSQNAGLEMSKLDVSSLHCRSDSEIQDIEDLMCMAKTWRGNVCLEDVRCLHRYIYSKGLESLTCIVNHVIGLYVECQRMHNAEQMLERLPYRTEDSWTYLISGHVENGQFEDALDLHLKMVEDCVSPSSYTLVALLKACAGLKDLERGQHIHEEIKKMDFLKELPVGNTLVGMYAKCGSLVMAHEVFDKLLNRNVVSWTALIGGYAEHGPFEEALRYFSQMHQDGVAPNDVSFVSTLKACGNLGAIEKGREIHANVIATGSGSEPNVSNSLIDMYAKCGSILEADYVFRKVASRNVVSWTSLIGSCAESGYGLEALHYFDQMRSEGIQVNAFTFACALKACTITGEIERGRQIHLEITQFGYDLDLSLANSLIAMYTKCGSLNEAQNVFDKLQIRDVVSWSALASGYAEHGPFQDAVKCFEHMQLAGLSPNRVTFGCALKACGSIGAINKGREIHLLVTKKGLENDVHVASTLIGMYAKCCCLSEAQNVFRMLPVSDVVTWSSMIKAYALNHEGEMAVQCYDNMKESGINPNSVTFTCLLTACSHSNLIVDGMNYFKSMKEEYKISPLPEHYACILTLLARSGHLFEAERFLEYMCPASKETWVALLTVCKTLGEVELGFRCFQELAELDQEDGAAWYVLMGEMYANAGRWEDVYRIEQLRIQARAYKKPAIALIEVNGALHKFTVGQSQNKEVSLMLQSWKQFVKDEGHVPRVNQILKPISDKHKESALCEHAEKIAMAFGILNTSSGQTLRISKNLRMCDDCHITSKMLSKREKREIILQDTACIHHFKDGECSCGDMF